MEAALAKVAEMQPPAQQIAGLKPGRERSFGCEAELLGLVVAQEPGAGSDLARNGMVTLYVAAPGAARVDGDAEVRSGLDPDSAPATVPQAVVPEVDAPHAPARTRRRRKPRKKPRSWRFPSPAIGSTGSAPGSTS